MFVDEVVIHAVAGNGGNGSSSFRREKFVPEGGPDGGNGGNGGNIVVIASPSFTTLSKFKHQRRFAADSGGSGSGRLRTGESGNDVELIVPLGTQIIDYDSDILLCDICNPGERFILVEGGRGGRGNASFKTSVNRAPRQTTPGTKGQIGKFIFRLKLLCDVGIIGLPNAGKSTLINSITNTKSAVGDYPFTTINPVLGMLEVNYKQYIVADIPGLIENAHQNVGLGHKFLRHVERCRAIIHLIDINSADLKRDYSIIRNELKMYNPLLAKKKEILVFSKIDAVESGIFELMKAIKLQFKGKKCLFVSSFTRENLENIGKAIEDISETEVI